MISENRYLKWFGVFGCLGACIMFTGDMLLFGSFANTSGAEFMADYYQNLGAVYAPTIRLGSLLGPFAVFFFLIGFVQIYYALRPAGRGWALLTFLFFAFSSILIGSYHFGMGYIGYLGKLGNALGGENADALQMMESLCWDHTYYLYFFGNLFAQIATALLFYTVLIHKTHYPSSIIYLTPIALLFAGNALPQTLPAPIGGYIAAGYSNLIYILFFLFATILVKKEIVINQD